VSNPPWKGLEYSLGRKRVIELIGTASTSTWSDVKGVWRVRQLLRMAIALGALVASSDGAARLDVETSWAEFLGQHQQLGTEAPTTTIWLDVELVDPVAIEDEERDRDVGLFDQPYFLGRHDHFREPSPHVGGGVHRCWDRGNRRLARSNPQIGQVRRLLGPASSRPSPSRWVPVLHVGQHALLPRRERPIRVAPAGTLESPERHLGGWAG